MLKLQKNHGGVMRGIGVRRSMTAWRLVLAAAIWLIALSSQAAAQRPVGNISGVVTDPTGAVIAGAKATATSIATGATRTATTNDQGFFLIPTLLPGDYKLIVQAQGFG